MRCFTSRLGEAKHTLLFPVHTRWSLFSYPCFNQPGSCQVLPVYREGSGVYAMAILPLQSFVPDELARVILFEIRK